MYRATREFIKARQKYAEFPVTAKTNVKKIGGGQANKCFSNAYQAAKERSTTNNKVVCVSGWVVQPFDQKNNCTAIIQHWWNMDSTGQHFDTSPLITDEEEYVVDLSIYQFGVTNFDRISSNLAKNLLYADGRFEILIDQEEMLFMELPELRTALLFGIHV